MIVKPRAAHFIGGAFIVSLGLWAAIFEAVHLLTRWF